MPFHGIHGLTFDPEGHLYVGSVVGQATYRVDPESGAIEIAVGPPDGCADDMEFGPDGRRYWTQLFGRQVVAAAPDGGAIQVLAKDRTGINSIAFKQDGRLFATEVFDGDALYEIDPKGEKEPRQILKDIGGLNGFDFGPDGKLYGPLWFKSVVARVDVDSGEVTTVATGFETPAAANFDSKGRLFVLDTARGEVVNVDTASGERKVVATLDPGLDNLAIDPQDRLFVTNMANNGIYHVDTETGTVRTVVEGKLAVPAALDLVEDAYGREVLHVADTFAYRTVDVANGEVKTVGTRLPGRAHQPARRRGRSEPHADHVLPARRRPGARERHRQDRRQARARDAVRLARARRRSLPGRRDGARQAGRSGGGGRREQDDRRGTVAAGGAGVGGREPRLRRARPAPARSARSISRAARRR